MTLGVVETRVYGFDANTNRTSLTTTPTGGSATSVTYTVDAQSDRLTAVVGGAGAGSVSYDVNGNTTLMPGRTLTWTASNRVSSASKGGVTTDYGFDPLGRVLTRTVTGSGVSKSATHHYASDADTPSWTVDVDAGVTSTTRYVSMVGGLSAIQTIGGQTVYPLSNPHGDVWAHTDGAGNVTATFAFDEYGNPGQAPSGVEGVDRYGWLARQQREWDPETGLTLMGVRMHDPTLGRFLSVDPVYGGSANHYDYVAGDPINGYDLDGRVWWRTTLKVAAIVGGIAGAIACGATIVCGIAVGAAAGAASYAASNAGTASFTWGGLATEAAIGGVLGGLIAFQAGRVAVSGARSGSVGSRSWHLHFDRKVHPFRGLGNRSHWQLETYRGGGKGFWHVVEVSGVEKLVRLDPNDVWTPLAPERVGDLIHDAYIDPEDFVFIGGVVSVSGELTWGIGTRLYRSELSIRMSARELNVVDLVQIGRHCLQDVLVVGDALQFLWVTEATATISPLPDFVEVRLSSQPTVVRRWFRWRSIEPRS